MTDDKTDHPARDKAFELMDTATARWDRYRKRVLLRLSRKDSSCSKCMFFKLHEGEKSGDCNRYPKPVGHKPEHWCGEFSENSG